MSTSAWQDEDGFVEASFETPSAHRFSDEDAFSDTDDDGEYKFSTETIRAEFAHSFSPTSEETDDGGMAMTSPQVSLDASLVSLGANANARSSPGSSLHPIASRESSLNFEQISLNDEPHDEIDVPPEESISDTELHRDEPNGSVLLDHPVDASSQIDRSRQSTPSSPDLHAVVIDASQTHPVPVEIHSALDNQLYPPSEQAVDSSHRSRHSNVESPSPLNPMPPSERAKSTSDLPLPPLSASLAGRPSSSHHKHKPSPSQGPSIFEQVVSKTRPPFLPPKKKDEDVKHLHDWEVMMQRSRVAEEKRRKKLQERRLAREAKVEESLHIWEKDVVPNWKTVREVPRLRSLWWAGIPIKLRAVMWERAVGNALGLSKDSYRTCLSRAKRALAAGTFPTTTRSLIEDDVSTTLPRLHIFNAQNGPMYEDLKDMLYAWVVARSDEGLGYVRGIAKLAAMIILNMPAPQGFVVLRNVLERHCIRSFYGGLSTKDDVEAYYRIFDTLLADGMPKIYFNFKQHQISPASYLPDWILPLFLDHLPFEACARLWDVILLEGDAFLYRASLAVLAVLEPRLFFPDRQELLELLRGENPAAIAVAKRDGQSLDGGKYEIYGVDEEALWDRIIGMEDWWKESTWRRLLQRELPDL